MSKHIRMLNPTGENGLVRNKLVPIKPCYVMPCDCAGPGGICLIIYKPIPR